MYHLVTKITLMEDPRTGNAKIHKLTDIVFMVIAAVMVGMSTCLCAVFWGIGVSAAWHVPPESVYFR